MRSTPVHRWCLVDLLAVLALWAVPGGGKISAHRFLGPMEAGQLGIVPLGPDMLAAFMTRYAYYLNYANPLTWPPPVAI